MTVKENPHKYVEGIEVKIVCPDCGNPFLVVRTNTKNGGQFLGCPNYPDCRHSEPIPEAWKMRAEGQPELFQ